MELTDGRLVVGSWNELNATNRTAKEQELRKIKQNTASFEQYKARKLALCSKSSRSTEQQTSILIRSHTRGKWLWQRKLRPRKQNCCLIVESLVQLRR